MGKLPLIYVLGSIVSGRWATRLIKSGRHEAAMLMECIWLTVTSLFWAYAAYVQAHHVHSVLGGLLLLWDITASVLSLALAQMLWDRWNNRRRRKRQRVAGKVGLRLGRLVIVPED